MQPEAPTVRRLFDTAIDLTGAARIEFLAGLDPVQRDYLERLLAAAESETGDGPLYPFAREFRARLANPEK